MKAFAGTIRWRLTFWYSLSIVLIYLLFAGCVFLTFRYGCVAESRMRLDGVLSLVTRAISMTPGHLASVESALPDCAFYVASADGRLIHASAAWNRTAMPAPARADQRGYALRASPIGRHYAIREASVQIDGQPWRIGVAEDEQQTIANLNRLLLVLLFSLPGMLLLSVPGGYFLAGRLLSPVDDMARKAESITAEDLSQRLTVGQRQDEFDRLARVFNATFDRLEGAFDKMRRFMADASHELRTPLAVIRSQGENALKGASNAASYEEAIGSMLEEADRLAHLLEGLMTLSRAESERPVLNIRRMELGGIASGVVDVLRVLAEEKKQTLVFQQEAELDVALDRPTFEQALINLLANAIQYTQPLGKIIVRVGRCPDRGALVEVDDDGPGIASEHRDRIFERFYRIDAARTQAAGGSGLGLAIARWAVELNGGTVEYEAKPGAGSLFRIALPVAPEMRAKSARALI